MTTREERRRVHPALALAVTALMVVAVLAPFCAQASLSIEPAFIELALDEGRPSDVVTVANVTDQEVRYRTQAVHFAYDAGGNLALVEPTEQSLALWLKFNPKEFTLGPKESRAVRLTVVAPPNLEDGEYWAALHFEPLVGIVTKSDDGEGRSVAVEVRANILVPVVGHVGELVHVCGLEDLKAWRTQEGIAIAAGVANTGNSRVRVKGTYEIVDQAGTVVAEGLAGEDTILSGSSRVFTRLVEGDFAAEDYDVRVRYSSDRLEKDLAGQTQVRDEVPEGYADVTN